MKKIFKTLIDTIKDPNLLSSRPHHGKDHDYREFDENGEPFNNREVIRHHGEPQTCPWDDSAVTCPACNGSGSDGCPNDTVDELCETCGGGGKLPLHHQGWENDDKCCPNCGNTIQCICDLQGLSDLEKDSISMDGGASLELDLAFITISEDFGKMITIMEDEWMIVENKNATHYWFPEDITTKIVTHKIGKFLVTIQELKQ